MTKKVLGLLLLLCTSIVCAAQVPGILNIGTLTYSHWPSPSPSIVRPRSGVWWSSIETQRGQYSSTFAALDQWISAAKNHNTLLLHTFYGTPRWASSDPTLPPRDVNAVNEICQAPLSGVKRPKGDCIWAEYITKFMQHVCGVSAQPAAPLKGVCKVRYFEPWNEFNDGQFWSSNYTDMAKMSNDAATIIKKYCGDCLVFAGNTSAGGDGYNPNYIHVPAVAGRFDLALGQLLDAWHAIPGATLPDAVSYHMYGARRNVIPYPFPETIVSHGSSLCTQFNTPNPNCRTPVFKETAAVRAVLQQRAWAANLHIWNTEGGFGRNDDLTDGVNQSSSNTKMLREAYVARWMLAVASTGTVANLWYEWDDACWGTMMGYGIAPSKTGCPSDPAIAPGYTPIHQTWVMMTTWLQGAQFTGPCTNTGAIWRCSISKANYHGTFMWTTDWLASTAVPVTPTYARYRDLDGNVYSMSGASHVTVTNRPILLEQ